MPRFVERIKGENCHAVIRYDGEWDEYIVKFFHNQEYLSEADYFTDDKDDAVNTAKAELRRIDHA